ncbi:MAG: hypothetical protein OEO79_10810, partial [Gemmatimonadota bacterium]|nr:hypothetical protein [Gemmatimonadota bacterium]
EHIEEPSGDRQSALCALYDTCGGCQLQHLPYEQQVHWKGRIVADALTRIGHMTDVQPPEVVHSPRETEYRNRVSFTLRRLRGGLVVAGFHALGRPAHVIDVKGECVLPRPALQGAWKALRLGWGQGARLLPASGRLRLTLRETSEGVALVVDGGQDAWSAKELSAAVPSLSAIWHRSGAATSEPRLLTGVFDEGGPAFVQVNPEVATMMRDRVVEVAGEGTRAVDAYCGVGGYGRALAEKGWDVTGIERDPGACTQAEREAPTGFSVLQGTVESLLPKALPADLLIVNPPRTGLDPDTIAVIAGGGARRVVYVSCDPATLARDVAGLAGSYAVESVVCFDLFPQTAHVETVLVMTAR